MIVNDPLSIYFITIKETEPAKKNSICIQKSFFSITNILEKAINIALQQAFQKNMHKPSIQKIEKLGIGFCDFNELNDIFEYRRNHAK